MSCREEDILSEILAYFTDFQVLFESFEQWKKAVGFSEEDEEENRLIWEAERGKFEEMSIDVFFEKLPTL